MSRNINVYILLRSNSLRYGSMTQDHSYIDSTGLYLWNLCWVELFGPRTHPSHRLKLVQVIQIAAFWDALFSPVSLFSVLIMVAWSLPLDLFPWSCSHWTSPQTVSSGCLTQWLANRKRQSLVLKSEIERVFKAYHTSWQVWFFKNTFRSGRSIFCILV